MREIEFQMCYQENWCAWKWPEEKLRMGGGRDFSVLDMLLILWYE